MRVRAYTLAVNANHAPHIKKHDGLPLLTLANCKPGIRKAAQVGDWIAAITPKAMDHRLAFLMKVDGIWTRKEYWNKFENNRADSIYKPKGDGFELQANPFHGADGYARDTSCDRILWSNEFYYFAEQYDGRTTNPTGLILDPKYGNLCRSMRTRYGYLIDVDNDFVGWIKNQPGRLSELEEKTLPSGPTCSSCHLPRREEQWASQCSKKC